MKAGAFELPKLVDDPTLKGGDLVSCGDGSIRRVMAPDGEPVGRRSVVALSAPIVSASVRAKGASS